MYLAWASALISRSGSRRSRQQPHELARQCLAV